MTKYWKVKPLNVILSLIETEKREGRLLSARRKHNLSKEPNKLRNIRPITTSAHISHRSIFARAVEVQDQTSAGKRATWIKINIKGENEETEVKWNQLNEINLLNLICFRNFISLCSPPFRCLSRINVV